MKNNLTKPASRFIITSAYKEKVCFFSAFALLSLFVLRHQIQYGIVLTLFFALLAAFSFWTKKSLVLLEQGIIINDDGDVISYSRIKRVFYRVASINGENSLTVYYDINGDAKRIGVTCGSKNITPALLFLKGKAVVIESNSKSVLSVLANDFL